MPRYIAQHLPPDADGSGFTRTASFDRIEATEGTANWLLWADGPPSDSEEAVPCVDLTFRGPGGALVSVELTLDQTTDLTNKLLGHIERRHSTELLDHAVEVLLHHGWHESCDGALNPPVPEPYGFTVQVTASSPEEAEKVLLRRLRDAGDRDRFTVKDTGGETVWSGA